VKGRCIGAIAVLALFLGGAQAAEPQVPHFRHVIVVVMENKAKRDVLRNADAPNFNSLASRYAVLTRYRSVAHPSLPNYLALVSGSTHGIHSDCTSCLVSGRNLADTLERARMTWKAYAERLPRPGWTGASADPYVKRHVPFLYFRDVLASPARRRHVVPLRQLSADLAERRLPDLAFVVPDMCHDMHDCSVREGDAWLGRFLPPLLKLAESVVFVVFDEAPRLYPPTAPVPALALGQVVEPGSQYLAKTSHYGLLRTIEDAWGLPRLGLSKRAQPITGIWRSIPEKGSAGRG
jgi:acid phosphatase